MDPDRFPKLFHGLEHRAEFGGVERLALHVREDLYAASLQVLDRSLRFANRAFRLIHGDGGDKSRETMGIFLAQLSHAVAADSRKLARDLRPAEDVQRGRRE